jgi:hypothetical protein
VGPRRDLARERKLVDVARPAVRAAQEKRHQCPFQ